MKNYYRIMLGRKGVHAEECFRGNFIGAGFGIHQDLTGKLPENWREFNKAFKRQAKKLNEVVQALTAYSEHGGSMWLLFEDLQP